MGVDFLKYPERDIWPNWSSGEYRERIKEQHVATDSRAAKRDYFSILLEGALLNIDHGIRLRFRRGQDERPSDQRYTTCKVRHLETISTSVAVALSSLLPGVAMLVLFYLEGVLQRIVLVLIFTTMFSAFLKIFTSARTAEFYAATAYKKHAVSSHSASKVHTNATHQATSTVTFPLIFLYPPTTIYQLEVLGAFSQDLQNTMPTVQDVYRFLSSQALGRTGLPDVDL